jgi:negative regulator of sigma E activity
MKTNVTEHLSAVFDDEATAFEQRRLLDEVSNDQALQSVWSRYALIGETLREKPATVHDSNEFLQALNARLEDEPAYDVAINDSQEGSVEKRGWLRPVMGMAAAVAVVSVAVIAMQDFNTGMQSQEMATNTTVSSEQLAEAPVPIISATTIAEKQAERARLAELERERRMQRYLASHIEYASRSTIAPTVRTIAYGH